MLMQSAGLILPPCLESLSLSPRPGFVLAPGGTSSYLQHRTQSHLAEFTEHEHDLTHLTLTYLLSSLLGKTPPREILDGLGAVTASTAWGFDINFQMKLGSKQYPVPRNMTAVTLLMWLEFCVTLYRGFSGESDVTHEANLILWYQSSLIFTRHKLLDSYHAQQFTI